MSAHFERFYLAVNAEWPMFNQTEEEARDQERRWRFVLGSYDAPALHHAMKRALESSKKRPKVAELVEWCREALPKAYGVKDRILPHWTRCACGCDGKLWYLVLRDARGQIRYHAATVEEMTGAYGHVIAAKPDVAEGLAAFCGVPMTRTKCECKKHGGDGLPAEEFYVGLENGVPVYDPYRGVKNHAE